jgi:TPR repeat protein
MRGRVAYTAHQDYATAACWFHVAAMRGDAHSQAVLALMLAQGYPGLPRDDAQAFHWAKQSAGENDYDGEMALAMLYRAGHGTSRDVAAADFWASKAHKEYVSDPKLRAEQAQAENTANVGGMLVGAMAVGVLFGAFL